MMKIEAIKNGNVGGDAACRRIRLVIFNDIAYNLLLS